MTKEIYHEGWLIKSPPTKGILRARWRRRWFTLKQGEIPEQFCLEYYKDRSCRKLKGVIDLDQCEQVDSGLRLEHRKQKFQYMFDVKTPLRTYYLAANSEDDMNAWVSRICEVCNLQDLSKPQQQMVGDMRQNCNPSEMVENHVAPNALVTLKTTNLSPVKPSNASDQVALLPTAEPIDNNNSVYQNYDAMCRHSTYNNRETLICDAPLNKSIGHDAREPKEDYYNFTAIANTSNRDTALANKNGAHSVQSIGERRIVVNQSVHRKIPENLKLNSSNLTPSSMNNSSGQYIALWECVSGTNPLAECDNPTTPLNSLDPKFYDAPRSHFNIGLNLTNEQPYSPKRNNIPNIPQTPLSGKSSPTDSDDFTDVFTDEEWMPTNPNDSTNGERSMRPSESSIENDSIVFTYTQRFSKMPNDESVAAKRANTKRPIQVAGLSINKNDSEEHNKDVNSSDTENASPAITYGPKDMNSYVDESYDIPRSHQFPYTKMAENNNDESSMGFGASGTSPSLSELNDSRSGKKHPMNINSTKKRSHFYTNAAPSTAEGNVFRYDIEDSQSDAPIVDRKLKPRVQLDDSEAKAVTPIKMKSLSSVNSSGQAAVELKPPHIDRKLKPTTPIKLETSTLQRRGGPTVAMDAEFQGTHNNEQVSKTLPRNYNNSASNATATTAVIASQSTVGRPAGVLEYFDLDHSNPPPICNNANTSVSTSNLNAQTNAIGWPTNNLSHRLSSVSLSSSSVFGNQNATSDVSLGANPASIPSAGGVTNAATASGIVYKSVDFIKTEAFMRTRQDIELARAQNRSKE